MHTLPVALAMTGAVDPPGNRRPRPGPHETRICMKFLATVKTTHVMPQAQMNAITTWKTCATGRPPSPWNCRVPRAYRPVLRRRSNRLRMCRRRARPGRRTSRVPKGSGRKNGTVRSKRAEQRTARLRELRARPRDRRGRLAAIPFGETPAAKSLADPGGGGTPRSVLAPTARRAAAVPGSGGDQTRIRRSWRARFRIARYREPDCPAKWMSGRNAEIRGCGRTGSP
jgi:hypothetical protein